MVIEFSHFWVNIGALWACSKNDSGLIQLFRSNDERCLTVAMHKGDDNNYDDNGGSYGDDVDDHDDHDAGW